MSEVEELEARVRDLPRGALAQFRDWFHEFENDLWDGQIKNDFKTSKFDHLIATAREEFAQGKAREL